MDMAGLDKIWHNDNDNDDDDVLSRMANGDAVMPTII